MEDYEEVKIRMNQEGIDYFLMRYTDAESMPDKKGQELFAKAKESLDAFTSYVEEESRKNYKRGRK